LVGFLSLIGFSRAFQLSFTPGIFYSLRLLNFIGFYFCVSWQLGQKQLTIPKLIQVLGGAVTIFALLGLGQFIFFPDSRALFLLGWDDHLNRLIGTFLDPNFSGAFLTLGFLLFELKFPKARLISALLFVATILTYSRGGFLVLAVSVILLGVYKKSFKYILSLGTLMLVLILALPHPPGEGTNLGRTTSIATRVTSQEQGISAYLKYPILGVGFNNYPALQQLLCTKDNSCQKNNYPNHSSAPDNSFLFVFITTGLLGATLFLGWLWQILRWSIKHSFLAFSSLIVISIHSLFNNTFFYPFIMVWMFVVLSMEESS
jgi:O-antigen ligase